MPQLGRTQYRFGTVVFTLNVILSLEGFVNLIIEDWTFIKGPKSIYKGDEKHTEKIKLIAWLDLKQRLVGTGHSKSSTLSTLMKAYAAASVDWSIGK